jgi:hypothetical protein
MDKTCTEDGFPSFNQVLDGLREFYSKKDAVRFACFCSKETKGQDFVLVFKSEMLAVVANKPTDDNGFTRLYEGEYATCAMRAMQRFSQEFS